MTKDDQGFQLFKKCVDTIGTHSHTQILAFLPVNLFFSRILLDSKIK